MGCTRRHTEPKTGGMQRGRKQTRKQNRRGRIRTRKHVVRRTRARTQRQRQQRGGTPTVSLRNAYGWLDQAEYNLAGVKNLLFTTSGLLDSLKDKAPAKSGAKTKEALPAISSIPLARAYCSLGNMSVMVAE